MKAQDANGMLVPVENANTNVNFHVKHSYRNDRSLKKIRRLYQLKLNRVIDFKASAIIAWIRYDSCIKDYESEVYLSIMWNSRYSTLLTDLLFQNILNTAQFYSVLREISISKVDQLTFYAGFGDLFVDEDAFHL